MAQSIGFGARSTADQVLAGVDLTRKRMVVTGCESGIGLETMKALAANDRSRPPLSCPSLHSIVTAVFQ